MASMGKNKRKTPEFSKGFLPIWKVEERKEKNCFKSKQQQ